MLISNFKANSSTCFDLNRYIHIFFIPQLPSSKLNQIIYEKGIKISCYVRADNFYIRHYRKGLDKFFYIKKKYYLKEDFTFKFSNLIPTFKINYYLNKLTNPSNKLIFKISRLYNKINKKFSYKRKPFYYYGSDHIKNLYDFIKVLESPSLFEIEKINNISFFYTNPIYFTNISFIQIYKQLQLKLNNIFNNFNLCTNEKNKIKLQKEYDFFFSFFIDTYFSFSKTINYNKMKMIQNYRLFNLPNVSKTKDILFFKNYFFFLNTIKKMISIFNSYVFKVKRKYNSIIKSRASNFRLENNVILLNYLKLKLNKYNFNRLFPSGSKDLSFLNTILLYNNNNEDKYDNIVIESNFKKEVLLLKNKKKIKNKKNFLLKNKLSLFLLLMKNPLLTKNTIQSKIYFLFLIFKFKHLLKLIINKNKSFRQNLIQNLNSLVTIYSNKLTDIHVISQLDISTFKDYLNNIINSKSKILIKKKENHILKKLLIEIPTSYNMNVLNLLTNQKLKNKKNSYMLLNNAKSIRHFHINLFFYDSTFNDNNNNINEFQKSNQKTVDTKNIKKASFSNNNSYFKKKNIANNYLENKNKSNFNNNNINKNTKPLSAEEKSRISQENFIKEFDKHFAKYKPKKIDIPRAELNEEISSKIDKLNYKKEKELMDESRLDFSNKQSYYRYQNKRFQSNQQKFNSSNNKSNSSYYKKFNIQFPTDTKRINKNKSWNEDIKLNKIKFYNNKSISNLQDTHYTSKYNAGLNYSKNEFKLKNKNTNLNLLKKKNQSVLKKKKSNVYYNAHIDYQDNYKKNSKLNFINRNYKYKRRVTIWNFYAYNPFHATFIRYFPRKVFKKIPNTRRCVVPAVYTTRTYPYKHGKFFLDLLINKVNSFFSNINWNKVNDQFIRNMLWYLSILKQSNNIKHIIIFIYALQYNKKMVKSFLSFFLKHRRYLLNKIAKRINKRYKFFLKCISKIRNKFFLLIDNSISHRKKEKIKLFLIQIFKFIFNIKFTKLQQPYLFLFNSYKLLNNIFNQYKNANKFFFKLKFNLLKLKKRLKNIEFQKLKKKMNQKVLKSKPYIITYSDIHTHKVKYLYHAHNYLFYYYKLPKILKQPSFFKTLNYRMNKKITSINFLPSILYYFHQYNLISKYMTNKMTVLVKAKPTNVFAYIIYKKKLLLKKTIGELFFLKKKDRRFWRNVYKLAERMLPSFYRIKKKYGIPIVNYYLNGNTSLGTPIYGFFKKKTYLNIKDVKFIYEDYFYNTSIDDLYIAKKTKKYYKRLRLEYTQEYNKYKSQLKEFNDLALALKLNREEREAAKQPFFSKETFLKSFNKKYKRLKVKQNSNYLLLNFTFIEYFKFLSKRSFVINSFHDITTWPFNGCKKRKK